MFKISGKLKKIEITEILGYLYHLESSYKRGSKWQNSRYAC